MKHIALPHRFDALPDNFGHRVGQIRTSAHRVAAAAAAIAGRFAPSPSRSAQPRPASVQARPKTIDRQHAVRAAVACPTPAASRWARQGTGAVRWVEGLVLILVMTYFVGGLAAIVGGL